MKTDPTTLVPKDKGDTSTALRATMAGYPAVAPVLSELFEWLQDGNWPVFAILGPFLAKIGPPIVAEVRNILASKDDLWKYWVLVQVLAESSSEVIQALRDDLIRIGHSPTAGEIDAEADAVARDLLDRIHGASPQ